MNTKIGIIGTGKVGAACTLTIILRGCASEIVLLDKERSRAKAVATDMRHGAPLSPVVDVRDGGYADLAGASLVIITAGINEKTGAAIDRKAEGRLKLLMPNATAYEEIVPQVVKVAPEALILVVTDPPDPLADLARHLAQHNRVVSAGTFLDSLRFRVQLAQRLGVSVASVDAQVLGEHGKSAVFLWSSARVCGVPVLDALARRPQDVKAFCAEVEQDVLFANISIIEGNDASQFGIGMVTARITEAILRDEHAVIPIGSYSPDHDVTLSLPSVVGRSGVSRVLKPDMSDEERHKLAASAATLKKAWNELQAGKSA